MSSTRQNVVETLASKEAAHTPSHDVPGLLYWEDSLRHDLHAVEHRFEEGFVKVYQQEHDGRAGSSGSSSSSSQKQQSHSYRGGAAHREIETKQSPGPIPRTIGRSYSVPLVARKSSPRRSRSGRTSPKKLSTRELGKIVFSERQKGKQHQQEQGKPKTSAWIVRK